MSVDTTPATAWSSLDQAETLARFEADFSRQSEQAAEAAALWAAARLKAVVLRGQVVRHPDAQAAACLVRQHRNAVAAASLWAARAQRLQEERGQA